MSVLQKNLALVIAGTAALGLGLWFGWHGIGTGPSPSLEALWAAHLNDLRGNNVALASMRGKPLIINFWATWCGPCKEEMPDFQRLASSEVGKRIQIVGIGIDNVSNMRLFSENLRITYTLLDSGPTGPDLLKALGNQVGGLPYTLIISRKEKLIMTRLGRISYEDLNKAASAALEP